MKAAIKILVVCISLAALLAVVVLLGLAELRRETASNRRRAEAAVTATLANTAKLEPPSRTIEAITNSAVAPAVVEVLGTDPVRFKVHAMTSWPDVMIYEYDSLTPERGVRHCLF